jgi:hypothetical protein
MFMLPIKQFIRQMGYESLMYGICISCAGKPAATGTESYTSTCIYIKKCALVFWTSYVGVLVKEKFNIAQTWSYR